MQTARPYDFIVDTYASEQLKTLTVWGTFHADNWRRRPAAEDSRGRTAEEHFMHQCISENAWFTTMLDIDVDAGPLPETPSVENFICTYAQDAKARLDQLSKCSDSWWQDGATFFDVPRSRAWVMLRRLTHSAHHRGQLTAMLRAWGSTVYSTYGPTADTGGLAPRGGQTRYPFASVDEALAAVAAGRRIGDDQPLPYVQATEKPDG